ncbi:MAG: helix-turn-helix domain-containing protein [Hydrogenophaga sp.]|uniref:helix-turn-helix domain-containing protein n=1 Tax=Hydrogenophaga sp. TaxID=1904254 RepID=UPI0026120234|nr:helix-turn-helix domain-containing protein [Hydrogenophaga sp.]MDM7943379.1 helix-turn-helix domain-containing protein [Hydrogenophaga sp.]
MTVKDVAAFLNVDDKAIYRFTQKGELAGFKVAGAWRFQRADIQGWIDAHKSTGPDGDEVKGGGA